MYLRYLEITGFKSFANRTGLVFEPGITAIVGPNGCGKSNVSDAIRWVLGEQRPSALRGSSMTDVIFNGTEARKPVNMTEVSITFADCEEKLGTDYNEVTVTRRVFRTGEGQYFINKTPCRLKDIQRLFMGTGIGTTSYSVMAQGQIDAVLSSRPEDRRSIFEEASGITRFRADRREAMRKLEQTDANLARVSDVIRELQRQINSLQRQVAKARRYKELKAELRKYDLFAAGCRLDTLSRSGSSKAEELANLQKTAAEYRQKVEDAESDAAQARENLVEAERAISAAVEASLQAQAKFDAASGAVSVNVQRMREYEQWAQRDKKEAEETSAVCEEHKRRLADETARTASLNENTVRSEAVLDAARKNFDAARAGSDAARAESDKLRSVSIELERENMRLRNELAAAEKYSRDAVLRSERLSAEKTRLISSAEELEAKIDEISGERETLENLADTHAGNVRSAEISLNLKQSMLREISEQGAELRARAAVLEDRIRLLSERQSDPSFLPSGNSRLRPGGNLQMPSDSVLGYAFEHISAEPGFRAALETAMHMWNSVLVMRSRTDAAQAAKQIIAGSPDEAARLFAAPENFSMPEIPPGTERLSDKVECSAQFRPFVDAVLGRFCIVDTLDSADFSSFSCAFVTPDGAAALPDGSFDIRMPDKGAPDPLSHHLQKEDAEAELKKLRDGISENEAEEQKIRTDAAALENTIRESRVMLDQSRRAAAQKEGGERALIQQLAETRSRSKQVSEDLKKLELTAQSENGAMETLSKQLADSIKSREQIAAAQAAQAQSQKSLEEKFIEAQSALTEARLAHAQNVQTLENARTRAAAAATRISELEKMINARLESAASYESAIQKLSLENSEYKSKLSEYRSDAEKKSSEAETLKNSRSEKRTLLEESENRLKTARAAMDEISARISAAEIDVQRISMARQNICDRLLSEWNLTAEEFAQEPKPEWNTVPSPDEADAHARELRAKIDDMGPVNLVAIDEYREIEERRAFLSEQETDLTNAKSKLLALIKDVDRKSTEMFRSTFEKANVNFQNVFSRLFNGGTAQLKLLDGDDVLESGIDIVAKPPGKKPQSVSLLSGGERTLTAVALLFAIYMIKPSPFAMLDELDAALDDSNIGRFVDVLKDFLDMSQFLIITHNQHTIAGADVVYGVTQQEKGVSKIISMRLKRVGVQPPEEEKLPEVDLPPPPGKRKMKNVELKTSRTKPDENISAQSDEEAK